MLILALDSTEKTSSVAIAEDDRLLGQCTVNGNGNGHSENLLPMIEGLLSFSGLSYGDIDIFAVSAGPGSFTGVRIGMATLKGIAFGRNKPCVSVSALEAMAYQFKDVNGIICPVMDARRGTLYNALFRMKDGTPERLTEDRTIPAIDLVSELSSYNEPIYVCGGGETILSQVAENKVALSPVSELKKYESGYGVALAAMAKYSAEGGTDDRLITPVYLRPSSAERMKNGQ